MMGPQARTGVQQDPQSSFAPAHLDILDEETHRLDSSLEMESARIEDDQNMADLEAELEEMELRLKQQEDLRERFINEVKEAKRELERLEREEREEMSSDSGDLNSEVTPSKFYNSVKNMKEKTLQQEFEDLKVAHLLSQEAFVAGIQAERKKTEAVQEELDQLKTSYKELRCKYEADISLVRQEVKREKDANIEREKETLKLVNKLRAEKEELFRKMAREIIILRKREKQMLNELDQVHISQEELKRRFERDNMDLQQEVETYQQQVEQERKAHLEQTKEDKKLLDNMRAEKEELLHKMSGEIETYKHQVEQERKAHLEQTEEDKKLLEKLRAEYAILQEITTTEKKILQDKERSAKAELDNVNGLYMELNSRFETEVTALKQQVEKHQEELICVKNDLQRARDDLLLADTLRAEEEGFQQQPITVSQEKEENSQNQVKVLNQEVSSEEDLSGEPLPGSSTDPESSEETEVAGETILEDLDNPDGKKIKSKISFWKKVRNTLQWKKPKKKQTSEDNQGRV
ncbi:calponin homology domain-containing protein DDB_G0272472-like [Xiphophorus couchianus]|uniref:calponin homology domain-containing protein DDB_G0272472-like n=1 Tax=Xiphophorus couchianus TaxID=32473 RepID=UPI0010167CF9|nr:calponin homology domain-containing protein DDB_G0272472-like [Xiphophorus couchianus]